MRPLRTVEPNGAIILHHNLEHLVALALLCGEEAREEGRVGEGHAGGLEGGLDDGVVGGEVVPLYDVADGGDDVVWVEEVAGTAGYHGVGYAGGGCAGSGLGRGFGWDCGGESGGRGEEGDVGEHVDDGASVDCKLE